MSFQPEAEAPRAAQGTLEPMFPLRCSVGQETWLYPHPADGDPTGFSSNLNYITHQQGPQANDNPPFLVSPASLLQWGSHSACCGDSVGGNVGHLAQCQVCDDHTKPGCRYHDCSMHGGWAKPRVCRCFGRLPFLAILREFSSLWVFHMF